jgi:hypothetical protein
MVLFNYFFNRVDRVGRLELQFVTSVAKDCHLGNGEAGNDVEIGASSNVALNRLVDHHAGRVLLNLGDVNNVEGAGLGETAAHSENSESFISHKGKTLDRGVDEVLKVPNAGSCYLRVREDASRFFVRLGSSKGCVEQET